MEEGFFLDSARLKFRPWTNDDIDLARGLWGDCQVTQFLGGPFGENQIAERLRTEMTHQEQYGLQYWPVFLKDGPEFIGCCGLRPCSGDESGVRELGYHLCPPYWRSGYGSEAAECVIGYAFKTLKVKKLFAGHHPQNANSKKILLRLGFQYIGDRYYPPTGLHHPCYELTRNQFENERN